MMETNDSEESSSPTMETETISDRVLNRRRRRSIHSDISAATPMHLSRPSVRENAEKKAKDSERRKQHRTNETTEERERRLSQMREKDRSRRESQSSAEHDRRLSQMSGRIRSRRESETSDECERRLSQMRERDRSRRESQSSAEHDRRLSQMRERDRSRRESQSSAEHDRRLSQMRERDRSRRESQSSAEHDRRLSQMRERDRSRRESQSSAEHDRRLSQMRERDRSRRESQSSAEHDRRLSQISGRIRSRRESETSEERVDRNQQARLRRHSSRQQLGIALTNCEPLTHYLDPMDNFCSQCGALHFEAESNIDGSYNSCCNHGQINLKENYLFQYPEHFCRLLTSSGSECVEFRRNIRNYNSSLALASMGAKLAVPPGRGPYCYKIHGQVYHSIGPLHPQGQSSIFGQLYIMDTDMAAEERMNNPANINCNAQLMKSLGAIIANVNPYAQAYTMMYEVEEKEESAAAVEGRKTKPVLMIFKDPSYEDRHRYNVPISNEVALIYVGDEIPETRSLAVHSRSEKLTFLMDTDEKCDPMTYPVFYPNGGFGWNINIKKKDCKPSGRNRVTQREYYAYLLHVRREFSPLFYGGKLFQQWIVDSWARTEQNRLHYLRTHQDDLRADSYKNISDYLASDNPEDNIGRKVVLPSTFQSGPRAMHQNYQDAMAIVARFGKPDYFLTITCNPNWREITEQLLPNGQSATDRPDLISRVFELKLQELLDDLLKRKVIGEVLAYVYVIEFQKRGLPHCHMLLTMTSAWKPRCSTDVDKIISAELPDEILDEKLHSLISTLMIHRPCGMYNPHSPCMRDGKCTKRYPKQFTEQTEMERNGYPNYKRPDNSRKILLKDIEVDNRWVVPYNPYFIFKYCAHMNLEVCALIHAVMYLFKYVYKGEDRAKLELKEVDRYDEVARYISARYLCSPEGVHRLLGYKMQGKSHTIVRLDLHLPQEQIVEFEMGKEEEALEKRNITKLTAFFILNEKCQQYFESGLSGSRENLTLDSRNFSYNEIPEHYIWDNKNKEWKERKREGNDTIGRMFTVSPKEKERFGLRILLINRKGSKSFEDIRTVQGIVFPTFTEAAKELGLLHDDNQYIQCMEEAKEYQMPTQLRSLFACLICFTEIHEPNILWELFKLNMADDFIFRGHSVEDSFILAYYDIADRTSAVNVQLEKIIPPPGPKPSASDRETDYVFHEDEGSRMFETLSGDQKTIVDWILNAINGNTACLCYIDGPGGCGKTYVYNCLFNILTGQRKNIINVCWSGIAATLLYNGQTVCSAFKLDVKNNCSRSLLTAQSMAAKLLLEADIFIWDEAPMAPKASLEAIDILLRDLTGKEEPFGGKIMLLGGDFRQVLPIVEHGSEGDMVNASIKNSKLWSHFKQFTLSRNLRLLRSSNNEWAKTLLEIGDGEYPANENGEIELDDELYLKPDGDLIDAVFGDLKDISIEQLANRAILAPKNVNVFELNQEVLNRMRGEEIDYISIDELESNDNSDELIQNFPTEFLNSMTPTGLPPHILKLKKNCLVMVLRNIDRKAGLVNGCRLIVREMRKFTLLCEFVTGTKKGQMVLLPRIELTYDKGIPFTLRRRQFPIRLCFAMTINKSQGQTFERVGLDLTEQVFAHGQLYVALSRTTSKSGIIIKSEKKTIRNVVNKEAIA